MKRMKNIKASMWVF